MPTFLLGVDGSECALRAVDQVVEQAVWYQEAPRIHLLHVHAPVPVGLVQAYVGHEALQHYYREEAEAVLEAAEDRLKAAPLAFERHLRVGPAAEVIVAEAAALGCHQIVLGFQGRGALASAVLGSVASRVLQRAVCPVLLVK